MRWVSYKCWRAFTCIVLCIAYMFIRVRGPGNLFPRGERCSSVVRPFDHGAMGRRIDPSWGGPIEPFLVPASAPRLV